MKNRKISKSISVALSCALVLSNIPYSYALTTSSNSDNTNISGRNSIESGDVYLIDGEDSTTKGNGTLNNPYRNIRTALKNIKDGQTLKIIGTVSYTKYDVHTDKSPLPLFINKNITIEGASGNSPTDKDCDSFVLRAPIQLGANVTFKNINLQLVPQVILGEGGTQSILGAQNSMAATIFAAGHTLTMDNVSTKVGTNPAQDSERPYISGGSYKNQGTLGKKSVINITNPNSQTKFKAIYAGDYWNDRNLDVEINLNGSLLENTIFTGGFSGPLTGTVDIKLGSKSNIYNIDNRNHNGKTNVILDKDVYIDNFNATGINSLTLNENSKLILKNGSNFDVENTTLKKDSVIDFRKANSLNIENNLVGGNSANNSGCILLSNNHTLNIGNEVSGFVKLNYLNTIYSQAIAANHDYIRAGKNSNGDFILDNIAHKGYILEPHISGDHKIWTAIKGKHIFKDFSWGSEHSKIINPSTYDDYYISLNFINTNGGKYIPYNEEWDDFEFTLRKANGEVLDENSIMDDDEVCFMINYSTGEVILNILKEDYEGNITLIAKNKTTNKVISKDISISIDKSLDTTPSNPETPEQKPSTPNNPETSIQIGTVSTLEAESKTYNSAELTWDKVEDVSGYEVYMSTQQDGHYTLKSTIKGNSTTSANISGLDTNTTYYFKVRAYKESGNNKNYGEYSPVISTKPTLSSSSAKIESLTYNSAKISWNEVSGANGYEIYVSNEKDGKYTLKTSITSGKTTSYTNTNLNTNTTYYYKVRAYRIVGSNKVYNSYSPVISAKPTLSSSSAKIESLTYNSAKISWNAVNGASGYELYVSDEKDGKYTLKTSITSGKTTSYTDTNLNTNTTYYYKVRAYRTVGSTKIYNSYSPVISAKPQLKTTKLKISIPSYNSSKLSWNAVSGANGYEIYVSTEKEGEYTLKTSITNGKTTSYTDTNLNTNTTYYYKARAYRTVNSKKVYSPYSEIVSAKPVLKTPSAKAVAATYNSAKVSWSAISGATGYEIYSSTSKDGKYTLKKTISNKSTVNYTDTNLDTNTTYHYKMRAYRAVGDKKVYSGYSSVVPVKPELATISLKTSTTSKKATLKWNKIQGADGYEVYSSTESKGTYTLKQSISDANTVTFTDINLASGKTYYYKVRPYRNIKGKMIYGKFCPVKGQKVK